MLRAFFLGSLFCALAGLQAFAQTAPIIAQPTSINASDGFKSTVSLSAQTPSGAPVSWQIQVGSRVLNVEHTHPGHTALFTTSTTFRVIGEVGPFTMADHGLPVTYLATNAFGTSTLTTEPLFVTGRAPVFGVGQPADQSATAGSDVVFTAIALGSPTIQYQWKKNGFNIVGATSSVLVVRATSLADNASFYQVVATNPYGTAASSSATLTVTIARPTISQQPQSLGVLAGAAATFQVVAGGSPPFTFQWQKDGADLAGATQSSLTITSVQAAQLGSYTVTASNAAGSITSSPASLTISASPLAITEPPRAITAVTGSAVIFQVAVTGTGPITYQWRRDSTAIAGATQAILTFAAVSPTDAGLYSVVATNSAGPITSTGAQLTVQTPVTITRPPESQQVLLGAAVTLRVEATGTAPLSYQWRKDGIPLSGATDATLTLPSVAVADAGSYATSITNPAGTTTSPSASLEVSVPGRIANFSVMTSIAAPGDSFTVGVVVSGGTGNKPVLVRAAGPALLPFGASDVLADPRMEFFSGAEKLGENDDWSGDATIAAATVRVGAFPFSSSTSKDAALFLASAGAGSNSIRITGGNATTGTVLAELYDATPAETLTGSTPRLANVSVLKPLGSGLTAGFVVAGTTPVTVLVRIIGPGLATFGVTDFVADPRLDLFAGSTRLGGNDNWGGGAELTSAFGKVAAFALATDTRDAAQVVTLSPGNYSVQASSATASTGLALIEIYEVP